MGYDSLAAALDVLGGKMVEPVTNTPTIYFGRGNDALIKQFMDTQGNAIFEVPAAPAAPASSGKPLIAGVVFQSDTFMQTVQAGMQAAADKLGAEMIMGNTDNKLDKEASMIDDYITRGVKAIVITPISADGSIAALKKAKDAGITIFCFNTCVNDKTSPSGFLVTKNADLGGRSGAAAVKYITEKLGGKATVGILNCDQFEGCPPRKEGFLNQLKALPGVEVVGISVATAADVLRDRIFQLLELWTREYQPTSNVSSAPIRVVDGYAGPGYGKNVPEDLEIIRQMARSQGLLLDPVYTAKAFRGLFEEIQAGRFPRGSSVLFIHTGGFLGLFPRRQELLQKPALKEAP